MHDDIERRLQNLEKAVGEGMTNMKQLIELMAQANPTHNAGHVQQTMDALSGVFDALLAPINEQIQKNRAMNAAPAPTPEPEPTTGDAPPSPEPTTGDAPPNNDGVTSDGATDGKDGGSGQ